MGKALPFHRPFHRRRLLTAAAALSSLLAVPSIVPAQAADPIKFGFSMALTGGLAANGKAALLAMNMWAERINAKGGLLGRQVQLAYYDDQSNPANVPGLYAKLTGIDKVDILLSPYGTNLITPAMPLAMQKQFVIMGLFGVGANDQFNYDRYFQIMPLGPKSGDTIPEAFFEIAKTLKPAPTTVAIVGVDADFGKVSADAARAIAKKAGLKIVYDRSYPPSMLDLTPVVRAVQAAQPDLVFLASYPTDTVGIVRNISEVGLKARLIGGAPVGLQYAAIKTQLGPLMNNLIGYETYVPASTIKFPGIDEFVRDYQAKATGQGVDALGFYVPPFVYAAMQVLEQAIVKSGNLDQKALAATLHAETFSTIVGDIKFAKNGEWEKPRVLMVQYTDIVGNDLAQFRTSKPYSILSPPEFKTADPVVPFR